MQLKSTDALKTAKKDSAIFSFSLKRRHLVYWINEPLPVILIVYSVPDQQGYWLHMQPYLKSSEFVMPLVTQEEVTIHLSRNNVVDEDAIETFRQYKADALQRIEGLNLYG